MREKLLGSDHYELAPWLHNQAVSLTEQVRDMIRFPRDCEGYALLLHD